MGSGIVRWGIIGCGNVTEVKSGPGFQKAEGSALTAVMRRNGELARDYAHRHGVPRWYDDAEALIRDPEVDAIYIATPPREHMPYTLAAAAAGKPVYVEKPMAIDYAECLRMRQACEEAGVPLFVAYYRRAQPRFLHIKQLIDSGEIGEVRFVSTIQYRPLTAEDRSDNPGWHVDPAVSGGGYLLDVGSHTLDLLDYLLGPIADVRSHAANQAGCYAAEDIVSGSFRFESGALGTGLWCFTAGANEDRTEIVGDRGKITFATFGLGPVELQRIDGTRESFDFEPLPHVAQPLIQTVVDELLGRGVCPSTAESASRTSRVMDELIRPYRERS